MKGMIVVNADKCLGCKSCELACAIEHSDSKEIFQAIHESPAPAARVGVAQSETFAIPLQCRQCEDAPCVSICMTKALYREGRESPVMIDHDLCIGCKYCVMVCPFGVIRIDDKAGTVIKCDQCFERLARGEKPACVAACPTSALEFKSTDEVIEEKREAFLVQIEGYKTGGKSV